MKTQSSSIRRPGLTSGLLQRSRGVALRLAVAAAVFTALPACATPFYKFIGSDNALGIAAEADVTFKANQLDITLINTAAGLTPGMKQVLTGAIISLPGAGKRSLPVPSNISGNALLSSGFTLNSTWSFTGATTSSFGSTQSDLTLTLESASRLGTTGHPDIAGIVSATTGTTGAFNGQSFSLGIGKLDFALDLDSRPVTPDDFNGASVTFLFGNQGFTLVDAPVLPDPVPEPTPLSLIGLAMTILLVARKRF